jgi:hypothetical protein
MDVNAVCRHLDNRTYHLVMFQSRPVKLKSNISACRQLYMQWHGDANYDAFKKKLRFHFENGWLVVNVKKDYTPVVAGVGLAAGLGVGYGLYHRQKNKSTPAVNRPAPKSIKQRVIDNSGKFPDWKVVDEWLISPQTVKDETKDLVVQVRGDCVNTANWHDAQIGPAVFTNYANSCYFHASMLMLFQMREWLSAKLQNELQIMPLLTAMSTHDVLTEKSFIEPYTLVQNALNAHNITFQQQDANEFIMYLISRIRDPAEIQFGTSSHLNKPPIDKEVSIDKLVCNGRPIIKKNVQVFGQYWEILTDEQKDLSLYTLDGKIIIPKDKGRQECNIAVGSPAFDDVVNFEVQDRDEEPNHGTDTILKVVLRPDIKENTNVCELIQNEFNTSQISVVGVHSGTPNSLFHVKAKKTTVFTPNSKNQFYIVHFQYKPNEISGKHFTYRDAVDFQGVCYDLTCVIFRSGCGANSGHYTAALRIEQEWIYYNDYPQTRKIIPDGDLSKVPGTPFMMLFKRRDQGFEEDEAREEEEEKENESEQYNASDMD